jgi:hypothetical protein
VLLTYEKLGPVRDLLEVLGATAWSARANRAREAADPA